MLVELVAKTFQELTTIELYDLLALRSEVFVVEQNCIYQDIDNKDQKAIHVLMTKDQQLIGYSRIFAPNQYFKNASIGRVLIHPDFRKHQLGNQLMLFSIQQIKQHFNTQTIEISAQCYLEKFYQNLGFKSIGNPYLGDDIPHVKMIMN